MFTVRDSSRKDGMPIGVSRQRFLSTVTTEYENYSVGPESFPRQASEERQREQGREVTKIHVVT